MRLPVLFILVTVTLDAMGIGLIMPIMPELILEVQAGTLAVAAVWGGVLTTVFAFMQFLFSPVIGNLSDRFGRRPVLLTSLVVMSADYLVMAVAGSIWLLLIGRLIGGITAATQSTASAYIADISKPADKTANFGLIGAGFGIGFVLGPLIGGLLGEYGTRAPFYAAALLAALNFIFGYFVLTETVTDQIRRPFKWATANPFGAFKHMSGLPGVRRLLIVFFTYSVAFHVYPSVWPYFTQESFGWSPQMIGISLALFGIPMVIVQGGLIRIIVSWLGEWRTIFYSIAFDIAVFGAMAVVTSGAIALILIPLTAVGAATVPALTGVMSQMVGDDEQGAMLGVIASTGALAMIVSPMLMTSVFAEFTREGAPVYLPGAPFVVSMLLMTVALVVFLRSKPT
ncbi:MAG: TCR/Tet family MFS transporter [Rhodobacteraceae bacterium]|nr:TCR/Tet family MFS transporter [Paracoccaceae bacterium]